MHAGHGCTAAAQLNIPTRYESQYLHDVPQSQHLHDLDVYDAAAMHAVARQACCTQLYPARTAKAVHVSMTIAEDVRIHLCRPM